MHVIACNTIKNTKKYSEAKSKRNVSKLKPILNAYKSLNTLMQKTKFNTIPQ